MNKLLLICCGFALSLVVACSPTPNNVVMSTNQGQCLTNGVDGAPINNPLTAQYCMSVTVQNNNTGENANNVQVTTQGLVLSYSAIASGGAMQSYSAAICDNNASNGVCPNATNVIGNIQIYDPNNCATQQGSRVNTLMAGGGSCTFYLQLINESFAVGNYPINLTYNYTNSNQNYSISTTIFQNVNMYAGGTHGSYILNNGILESALTSNIAPTNAIIHDSVGNMYFNSGESVFVYNGLATRNLGTNLSESVNSLTIDSNNNLIAATQNGLFYFNLTIPTSWKALVDTNGVVESNASILGVTYTIESSATNIIYATESNAVYSCIESLSSMTLVCNNINTSVPAQYSANSIFAYNGALYAGSTNGIESYLGVWSNYMLTPPLVANAYTSSIFVNNSGIYFGVNSNSVLTESSIYYCTFGSNACVIESSGSGNYVKGNIAAITLDGANNIYGVGSNINSGDFPNTTNVYGVYESGIGSTRWQPIISNVESLSTVTVVSSLVN